MHVSILMRFWVNEKRANKIFSRPVWQTPLFTSSLATLEITWSWRQLQLPGWVWCQRSFSTSSHTNIFQTELVGREPHHWPTVEAAHKEHDLHQLCRPEHPCGWRRLWSSEHVLGILGISLDFPTLLSERSVIFILLQVWQPVIPVCRLEGTGQCNWYQRKCHNTTPGQKNHSLQWWRKEDFPKISRTV